MTKKPQKWDLWITRSIPLIMVEYHKKAFFSALNKRLYGFTNWIRYENRDRSVSILYPKNWKKTLSDKIKRKTDDEIKTKIEQILSDMSIRKKELKDKILSLKKKQLKISDFEEISSLMISYFESHLSFPIILDIVYQTKSKVYKNLKEEINKARMSRVPIKDVENFLPSFGDDDIVWYSIEELRAYLSTGVKLSSKEVEKRKKTYVLISNGLNDYFQTKIKKNKRLEQETIRGRVAYKAKEIKGIIKVVLHPKELKKFKKGDILVAHSTSTWYNPVLKKVSAIITDEGGLTCHAAIVSRELKIPCIIGTKIATKVLKDGDLVEVDAEKGIVRKL